MESVNQSRIHSKVVDVDRVMSPTVWETFPSLSEKCLNQFLKFSYKESKSHEQCEVFQKLPWTSFTSSYRKGNKRWVGTAQWLRIASYAAQLRNKVLRTHFAKAKRESKSKLRSVNSGRCQGGWWGRHYPEHQLKASVPVLLPLKEAGNLRANYLPSLVGPPVSQGSFGADKPMRGKGCSLLEALGEGILTESGSWSL